MGSDSMYQFFVRDENITGDEVVIEGQDAFHLVNVVRIKKGERVRISTDSESNYLCEFESASGDRAQLRIVERNLNDTELAGRIHLFQGIPKKERFEYVIEKTTELGVYEIIPVRMRFCVAKIDGAKTDEKIKRLQMKAEAAAKQSKRSHVPVIASPVDFSCAVRLAQDMDVVIVPYENATGVESLRDMLLKRELAGKDVALFIGPEGGFAREEIEALYDTSLLVSLGKRILRTDTAAIMTVGLVSIAMEE